MKCANLLPYEARGRNVPENLLYFPEPTGILNEGSFRQAPDRARIMALLQKNR